MILPVGAASFKEAMIIGAETWCDAVGELGRLSWVGYIGGKPIVSNVFVSATWWKLEGIPIAWWVFLGPRAPILHQPERDLCSMGVSQNQVAPQKKHRIHSINLHFRYSSWISWHTKNHSYDIFVQPEFPRKCTTTWRAWSRRSTVRMLAT